MKKRILFIGLYDDHNFGDPIIGECTEWLYRRQLGKLGIGLDPEKAVLDYADRYMKTDIITRIFFFILRKLKFNNDKLQFTKQKLNYLKYYNSIIEKQDLIVVNGGGLLKFKVQFFGPSLYALLDIAKKHSIPVIFNSIGVEGFDNHNFKCKVLKKILRHKALKAISTRDDILTLKDKYYDQAPPIPCDAICDPAVWSSETFGIHNQKSNAIGIGIIRKNIFSDYGSNIDSDVLKDLYLTIVQNLADDNYNVSLFTNGLELDNEFAVQIKDELLRQGYNVSLYIPTSPRELVRIISNYKAIIAGRLHAIIIAYSLDIPAIGLVWNTKLSLFGKNIGHPENFIGPENMESHQIINSLKKAIKTGYNKEIRNKFKESILEHIDRVLLKTCKISMSNKYNNYYTIDNIGGVILDLTIIEYHNISAIVFTSMQIHNIFSKDMSFVHINLLHPVSA